jgi:hypothetical protein
VGIDDTYVYAGDPSQTKTSYMDLDRDMNVVQALSHAVYNKIEGNGTGMLRMIQYMIRLG